MDTLYKNSLATETAKRELAEVTLANRTMLLDDQAVVLNGLRDQLAVKEMEIIKLGKSHKKELSQKDKKIDDFQEKVQNLEKEVKNLSISLKANNRIANENLKKKENSNRSLLAKNQELLSTLAKRDQQIIDLGDRVKNSSQMISKLKKLNASLNNVDSNQHQIISELMDNLKQKDAEHEVFSADLKAQIARAKNEVVAANSKANNLDYEMENLKRNFENQKADFLKKIDDLNVNSSNQAETILELETKNQELVAESASKEVKFSEISTQNALEMEKIKSDFSNIKFENQSLTLKLEHAQENFDRISAEKQEISEKLENEGKNVADLQEQMNTMTDNLKNTIFKHENLLSAKDQAISDYDGKIDDYITKVGEKDETLAFLKNKIESMQNENSSNNQKCKEATKKLAKLNHIISKQKVDITKLQADYDEKELENKMLRTKILDSTTIPILDEINRIKDENLKNVSELACSLENANTENLILSTKVDEQNQLLARQYKIIKETRSKLNKKEVTYEKLKAVQDQCVNEAKTYKNLNHGLQNEISKNLVPKIKSLEHSLNHNLSAYKKLNNDATQLRNNNHLLTTELEKTKNSIIPALENNYNSQLVDQKRANTEISAKIQNMFETLKDKNEKIKQLSEQILDLENDIKNHKLKISSDEKIQSKLEKQILALENNLEQGKKDLISTISSIKNQMSKDHEIQKLTDKQYYESQLQNMKADYETRFADYFALEKKMHRMEVDNEKKEETIGQLRDQIFDLKEENKMKRTVTIADGTGDQRVLFLG